MKTGKFILSTLAYAALSTLLAVVWHEAFSSYYYGFNIYSNANDANIAVGAVGSVLEGLVITWLFQRFAPASDRVRFGVVLGVLLCLFASSYGVFQTAALERFEGAGMPVFIALEGSAMILYGVVCGALVAFINKN